MKKLLMIMFAVFVILTGWPEHKLSAREEDFYNK